MRDLVMVIADLYLPPDEAGGAPPIGAAIPGMERAGRFGARVALGGGWRVPVARLIGRTDLAAAAPARVAAAALATPARLPVDDATLWIATPVHLSAGLARVYLDHGGLLRLGAAELATLATEFQGTFGSAGLTLTGLASGDLLLRTPGLAALPTTEPARCAGVDVARSLPHGPAAGPLRRLVAEIEMWLHTLPLNEARRRRGELPVTTLWPWGASGEGAPSGAGAEAALAAPPAMRSVAALPEAYGRDAWLQGSWHLLGGTCRAVPAQFEELLAASSAGGTVLVTEVGEELRAGGGTVMEALARLDARFVSPAWRALARGALASFTVIVNDVSLRANRFSRFRIWRRRRAGLKGFA